MSFSGRVKEELYEQINNSRHCRIAELTAIVSMRGELLCDNNECVLAVDTENELVAKKTQLLIKKIFNIEACVTEEDKNFKVIVKKGEETDKLLKTMKFDAGDLSKVSDIILQHTCCKRAFLRGVFLSCGYVNSPENAYHFEIVCNTLSKAEKISNIIKKFEIDTKVVARKKCYVVYIKEGESIVDILNVMEAHVSLMEFENVRIIKDMRNSLNRRNNCDVANINKVVQTGVKQKEDIEFIRDTVGYNNLPDGLREIAILRMDNPDISLKDLGEMLNPPIGKSGVNHRLRKISSIAKALRDGKEDYL